MKYRRAIAAASATIPTCRGTTRSRASARSGEDYLAKALREYKSGERRGYDPAMAEVVQEMADADLAAVAHYLAYWR